MSSKKELLKTLTSHFEYLSQAFLPVISIEPLQKSTFPFHFKTIYGQPHTREQSFYTTTHYLSFDPKNGPSITRFPAFATSESDILVESISPNTNLRAIIRKKSEKTILEIWGKERLLQSVRVSDHHGALFSDAQFTLKSLVWSNDERKILYIAEKKEQKVPKHYDEIVSDEDADKILTNYSFKDDLGEGYTKRNDPILFLYNLQENMLYKVANIPEGTIPTYASFADEEGTKLVFCGYHLGQVKKGLKFCFNRDSKIYYIEKLALEILTKAKGNESIERVDRLNREEISEPIRLSSDFVSVFPIVDRSFTKLAYFFSPFKNTHAMGLGLKLINLQEVKASRKVTQELILDIVTENNPEFAGIMEYHDKLHKSNWLADSKHIVFNSNIGGAVGLFIVNVETKELKRIDKPKYHSEEWKLKNVQGNLIFASISNLHGHSKLAIYEGLDTSKEGLEAAMKEAKWYFFDLDNKENLTTKDELLSNLTNVEVEERVIEVNGIESLFFSLKEVKDSQGNLIPINKRPLMIALHGGPHGAATGMFSVQKHYSLLKGYNLLYPNFSGSTGYGQNFLEKLCGKISDLDVQEVKAIIDHCLETGLGDPNKLIVMGGSYGGYLGAVLIAKFPDLFQCAILKNPVVNLPSALEASDIPEWSYCEAFNKNFTYDPTSQDLKALYDLSPICMSKDIKASILLMVGGNDRRVPCAGAIQYYKSLKTKGIDVELMYYPQDEHGLSGSSETDTDQFVKTYAFIEEKLQRSSV